MIKRRNLNDTFAEKNIITGMIISDSYLKNIRSFLKIHLLQLPFTKVIAKWCVYYFDKYEKSPKETIQDIYNSKKDDLTEEQEKSISDYLYNLSEDYRKGNLFKNIPYMLDQAENYFKKRYLEDLNSNISSLITENNIEEAEHIIGTFQKVERPKQFDITLLQNDDQDIDNMLNREETDLLFRLPGTLGRIVKAFHREDFISFVAPPKRGKTFWLMEMAIRAYLAQLKVVFISLEMSRQQILKRIYQNLLGETTEKMEVKIPYFDEDNEVLYKTKNKEGLTIEKINKRKRGLSLRVRTGRFRLASFPANSVTIDNIKSYLDNLENYDNYIPDVVVVDYADIILPSNAKYDYRNQIDNIWKDLRSISQERHCLVVTASHSNRKSLTANVKQDSVVEDIRKLNHTTHMFALNQTEQEKSDGIMRVSTLLQRHNDYNPLTEVKVLQQLAIGKPYLDSRIIEKEREI